MDPKPLILIIDDEPAIGELLSYEFSARSFEVLQANDPRGALELFQKNRPNAVICDLHLEGQSGTFLLKEMKRLQVNLPFIFITGGSIFSIEDAYDCGADDLFLKPFKRSDIYDSVRRMLGKFSNTRNESESPNTYRSFTLPILGEGSIFQNPNLLFGRHGIFVFTDNERPQVNEMINLELKTPQGPLAVLTGRVRFTDPKNTKGYGLEIFDVRGSRSHEIKTFLRDSKSLYALPLPSSKG